MLESRGIIVRAIDVDVISDPSTYQSMRCFCSEIRRVRPDELYAIEEPESTVALCFFWGRRLPWREYLDHYPHIPLVVIAGEPVSAGAADCATEPSGNALDGFDGWRRCACSPVRAVHGGAVLSVYERVVRAGADAAVDLSPLSSIGDTAAAVSTMPSSTPSTMPTPSTMASNAAVTAAHPLRPGARVRIASLQKSPQLNGVEASLLSFQDGRWAVRIVASGEGIRIQPANLLPETLSIYDRLAGIGGGLTEDLLGIIVAHLGVPDICRLRSTSRDGRLRARCHASLAARPVRELYEFERTRPGADVEVRSRTTCAHPNFGPSSFFHPPILVYPPLHSPLPPCSTRVTHRR